MNKFKRVILFTCLLTISACGGGGGGDGDGKIIDDPSTPATNNPPTINAGADQTVKEGSTVQLSGSGNDIEGSVSYLWQQISGTTVVLSATEISNPTFIAHQVENSEELEFSLTVTDNDGSSIVDTVKVVINNSSTVGDTETLLFYTHSLNSVDPNKPSDPNLIETTENLVTDSLFGITLPTQRESLVRSGVYNGISNIISDVRTYAAIYPKKNGKLYKTSALISGSHTPVQVSNESLAHQMCDLVDGGVKSDFANVDNSQYVYRLSGTDEVCDTADDIWKMVTIGMDAMQSPIMAKTPVIDIADANTGAISGWLVIDNGALQRCDADFTDCSFIVAVTDYANYKLKMADNFYLLEIDNQLFSYNTSSGVLSSAIFTFINGTHITVAASDSSMAYFGHGNALYQFPVDGASIATILTSETNDIQIVTPSVSNVIYQVGVNGLGKEIKSISKIGGTAISLAKVTNDDDIVLMEVNNTYIYYNIRNMAASEGQISILPILAGVVDEVGTKKEETPIAAWIGAAWDSSFDTSTTNSYGNSKTVLLAEGFNIENTAGGFAGAKVISIDAVSAIAGPVLGTFESSSNITNIYCLGFGPNVLCNASHVIDPVPQTAGSPEQTDIYFLNSVTPNTLTRVTNSENESELIMP